MCGIAGILDADRGALASLDLIQRMTAVLSHRGPDEGAVHLEGPVALGHRRLSIIDVNGGKQPIFSADKSKVIVFNGEIYNFRALRDVLLRRGYSFETESDTEVILHAYEEFGERCVDELRGMFAFAIWDTRAHRLFLARDRVGIKPLYYYWDGRKFLFGSEIKAILEDHTIDRTLDVYALDDYLSYLYVPAPKTIFRSIRKLRPGHVLTVTSEGVREREYWDLEFGVRDRRNEAAYAEGLLSVIREAVGLHLVSEVPLGAFLSGGLDSSVVVAVMAGMVDRPVTTASIGFREAGFDERAYARLLAARYGADAYERVVEADAAAILDSLVWHFDEPFADSSMVPTYYVAREARKRVTVCLSGDGGDENFAGYRRYRMDALENRIRAATPGGARRFVFGPLANVYPKADWLPRIFRGKTLLTNLSVSAERAYHRTMSTFGPEMKRRLYGQALKAELAGYDGFSVMEPYFERSRAWDPLSRIQYVDMKTYLVDDILTKVDRASMAHSLEVRVPLLDHKVMEYAATIPAGFKLRRGEGKYILKRAVRDLVPAEILHRPKMGFGVPLGRWLRRELRQMGEETLFARNAFIGEMFDIGAVREWWAKHQRGTSDYGAHLWALTVLERWGQRFVRGGGSSR